MPGRLVLGGPMNRSLTAVDLSQRTFKKAKTFNVIAAMGRKREASATDSHQSSMHHIDVMSHPVVLSA